MSPQLKTLTITAFVALAVAILLAVIAGTESREAFSDDALTSSLAMWSNFLLVTAVVAGASALVLSGVERALRAR